MPLINNDDREAHRKHLEAEKAKKEGALAEVKGLIPDIQSGMVEAAKRYFHTNGRLERCDESFEVKSDTLYFPLDECTQIVSAALASAFELPSSAFKVTADIVHGEYSNRIRISAVFTPPIS